MDTKRRHSTEIDPEQQPPAPPSEKLRAVEREIANNDRFEWVGALSPDDSADGDDERTDLRALTTDIETIAKAWFSRGEGYDDIEECLCDLPLARFDFAPHDPYPPRQGQPYPVAPLFRAFVIKELHEWNHETALRSHLEADSDLQAELGFETLPDQSTLHRAWHNRFAGDLQNAIEGCARDVGLCAARYGVPPLKPQQTSRVIPAAERNAVKPPSRREILNRAGELTDHAKRVVFPAFSLKRGERWSIHENAFWELQTYTGLRENMAVNEGARSFSAESTRDVTPLGHVHRLYLKRFSIEETRAMYHEAVGRIVDEAARTSEFLGYATVAIDTTADKPFTGRRDGHEHEIIGTKENNGEYAYQWATIQTVGDAAPPLTLDALPLVKGRGPTKYVPELLDSAQDLINIDLVLMDREFDSQHILEAFVPRNLDYLVPKRKRTSEKAKAKQLEARGQDLYVEKRGLHLGNNEWHKTTLIYKAKEDWDGELTAGHERYAVFMTSLPVTKESACGTIAWYSDRADIESGYKSVKRFMADTTSKHLGLRFVYFAFACLLCSLWRLIDLLVQLRLTGEYDRSPLVTANDVMTLMKKSGVG
jgi:IS4 transposase